MRENLRSEIQGMNHHHHHRGRWFADYFAVRSIRANDVISESLFSHESRRNCNAGALSLDTRSLYIKRTTSSNPIATAINK